MNDTSADPGSVTDYLASLDENTATDARALTDMMRRVSGGEEPQLWNGRTIGYGNFHYKYDSGREGDSMIIGFYPRKGKLTIYLMDGTTRHNDLLATLGKHTTTGYCVVIKRLSDIDVTVLEQVLQRSYDHIYSLAQVGPINRILWQTEK